MPYHDDTFTTVPRQQMRVACVNCAKSKTRCDYQHPCGRCRSRGTSCIARVSRRSAQSRRSIATQPLNLDDGGFLPSNTYHSGNIQMRDQAHSPEPSFESDNRSKSDSDIELLSQPDQNQPRRPSSRSTLDRQAEMPSGPLQAGSIGARAWPGPEGVNTTYPPTGQSIPALPGQKSSNHSFSITDTITGENTAIPESLLAAEGQAGNSLHHDLEDPAQFFPLIDWDWGQLLGSQITTPNLQALLTQDKILQSPSNFTATRPAKTPPRSVAYVASLGDNFSDTAPWSQTSPKWRETHFYQEELFQNLGISEETRERVLVTAQSFFHRALEKLGISSNPGSRFLAMDTEKHSSSRVLLLPPNFILSAYLEAFLTSFEPFYPMISQRSLNPNITDAAGHEEIEVLLLLLMFSYGAMRDRAIKARRLSLGLLEISRLALFDLLDRDNSTPRIAMTSQCAFLVVCQSAFSGHKRLVDSSLGQTRMYITLAKQSGVFKANTSASSVSSLELNKEDAWKEWLKGEYRSRLAYCWVMLDQEISLVHGCKPSLTMPELEVSLPASDDLWLATDASCWRSLLNERYGSTCDHPFPQTPHLSLPQLFRLLLEGKLDPWDHRLTILHMRLLLYPLHILIGQLCEAWKCSPKTPALQRSASIGQIFNTLRLREIRSLLNSWYDTFEEMEGKDTRQNAFKHSSLLLFHLLNLEIVTSFEHLEQHFQKASSQPQSAQSLLEAGVRSAEEAIVHCGQILRVIRRMEIELRPLWWPAAVYRTAIILRATSDSTTWGQPALLNSTAAAEVQAGFVIDASPLDDNACQAFLKYGRGRPCVTNDDGTHVPLQDGSSVLRICTDLLKQHTSVSYFAEALVGKLESGLNLRVGDQARDHCLS